MIFEFPRLSDAKSWAKDSKRKLQSFVEVDYFDSQEAGWRATLWTEGLPERTLLIHEKKPTKFSLAGKNVFWDKVFKSVQRTQNLQEVWVSCLKILG